MNIILRPDQLDLKNRIYDSWRNGCRRTLAVLPTGGGKSVIMSDIILDCHVGNEAIAVIAHRNELVAQMSLHVARRGIHHRIIGSKTTISEVTAAHREEFNGRSFIRPDARSGVISVDTLNARAEQLKPWCEQIRRTFFDEAHHVLVQNKWGKATTFFPNAYMLGVTASPIRADGYGLGVHHDGVFDDMVLGLNMRELINIGALCDYEIAIPESDFIIDDSKIAASGDWSVKRLREASERSHIVGDVVNEYIKRANGKRFILFATDVETSNRMAQRFMDAGIAVASVSAETPAHVRNDYIRRFKQGSLTGLVNVDLFGEGFDVPAVEVVIMARPTASLAVYLQQFGRALRTLKGKSHGLVIDHVSNWHRHGFPDKAHAWTLDRREKRGANKPKDPEEIDDLTPCRNCSRPYYAYQPRCPYCGAEPTLPEPGSRGPKETNGDLFLMDRETCEQLRKAAELESPASLSIRTTMAAGDSAGRAAATRQAEKIRTQMMLKDNIALWAGYQRALGRSDQESYRRFYMSTGVDVLTAQTLDRDEMVSLNEKIERWINDLRQV